MGLGHFGGNISVIQYLDQCGARLCITDQKTEEKLAESLARISDCHIESMHLGSHHESDFSDTDLVVVTPAVPADNRFLLLAIQNEIPVTTEMNLFWEINPARVIAITGSNGKSTTTALVQSILRQAGLKPHLGGNIGKSLLQDIHQIQPDDFVVLELSSFQLEYLSPLKPAPFISIITNLSPNHLEWHGSLDSYYNSKKNICRWQDQDQYTIIPEDDALLKRWEMSSNKKTVSLNESLKEVLTLPGQHNLINASLAEEVGHILGLSKETIHEGIRSFQGLPHRLEQFFSWNDRIVINDSIATTPESSIAALESFTEPIFLIAGGYDKQVDLSEFARMISQKAAGVALIGKTAPVIANWLESNRNSPGTSLQRMEQVDSLSDAVDKVCEWSTPGSVILLSPGCASYDQFRNFEERGETFKRLIREKCSSG